MNAKVNQDLLEDNLEESLSFIRNLKAANTVDNVPEKPTREYRRANPDFFGIKTSREFALLFRGYTIETVGDIHDIISIKFEEELHYYLCYKSDRSNINMDKYVYMPAYRDLIDDLSVYLNIEA